MNKRTDWWAGTFYKNLKSRVVLVHCGSLMDQNFVKPNSQSKDLNVNGNYWIIVEILPFCTSLYDGISKIPTSGLLYSIWARY